MPVAILWVGSVWSGGALQPGDAPGQRRVRALEFSLLRNQWNVSVTSRVGFAEALARVGTSQRQCPIRSDRWP